MFYYSTFNNSNMFCVEFMMNGIEYRLNILIQFCQKKNIYNNTVCNNNISTQRSILQRMQMIGGNV